jgi:tellurite resistance protein TerC
MPQHAPIWLWIALHAVLLALLFVDGWWQRASRIQRTSTQDRFSLWAAALWIAAALLYALAVNHALGRQAATEYLAGYGIEEALSIDNLFVFLVLFRSLHLDARQQHRIFFWGLAGAWFLRACAIAAGVSLLQKFFWMQVCMGAFLTLAGAHMLFVGKQEQQPRWLTAAVRRLSQPIPSRNEGQNPRPWKNKQFLAVLLLVQMADLLFAVDSIPAVLAVTHNFFLVYASNIFAVAGMRALYFVIAGLLERLPLLHYGLAAILLLAGGKLLLSPVWQVSATVSLEAIGVILSATIAASWLHVRRRVHN